MIRYSKVRTVLVIIMLSCAVSIASAQKEENDSRKIKVGFGIAFHDIYEPLILNGEAPLFYIPIDFGSWKMEPSISYRQSVKTNETRKTRTTFSVIGVGLFRSKKYEKTSIYYGIGLGRTKERYEREYENDPDDDYERETKATYISPTIGGEYFFGDHFSLGGEILFKRNLLETTSEGNPYYSPYELYSLNTKTLIILRYYF